MSCSCESYYNYVCFECRERRARADRRFQLKMNLFRTVDCIEDSINSGDSEQQLNALKMALDILKDPILKEAL